MMHQHLVLLCKHTEKFAICLNADPSFTLASDAIVCEGVSSWGAATFIETYCVETYGCAACQTTACAAVSQ